MSAPRILVAGVGNVFLGDDGFGVAVVERLTQRTLPEGVRVVDFGVRGRDLAFALTGGWDAAVLVDLVGRGDSPGTLYVLQPTPGPADDMPAPAAHAMSLAAVLSYAAEIGTCPTLWLVGCEPAVGEDALALAGLSAPVAAAVGHAADLVERIVTRLDAGETFHA